MEQSTIEIPAEDGQRTDKRQPGPFVVWLIQLIFRQPIGVTVACGFIFAIFVPSAMGLFIGLLIGLVATVCVGVRIDEAARSSQAEQLRSRERS